jgi:hypothetical protein
MITPVQKWIPSLLLLSLFVVGCSSRGSQFVGKWVNTTNPSDTMEITRNGEQFLIVSPNDKLGLGATYKDGFLQAPNTMGTMTLTYVKSSDTLIAPGLFGRSEYKRVDPTSNSPFGTIKLNAPNGQYTVSTPGGTITANSNQTYTAADLGTDVYPGAETHNGGMKMSMPTGSSVTAIFTTSDSKDQVVGFYKGKFGSDATVLDFGSSAILTVKKSDQESVTVTVTANSSQNGGKTQIAISHTIVTKPS